MTSLHELLDCNELKIKTDATKTWARSKQQLFKSIFTFVFNAVRRRRIYCLGRGFTCAKKHLQHLGWINVGKGIGNSKVCIRRMEEKLAWHHNLAVLRENAKHVLRSGDFLKDKRSVFLALIAGLVPNYIWINHRSDIRWNFLKPDQVVNKFPRVAFTTKVGLNRILNESNKIAISSAAFFPRCYEINNVHALEKFLDDYRLTACFAVLRWFHEKTMAGQVIEVEQEAGGKCCMTNLVTFCIDQGSRKLQKNVESVENWKMPFSWQTFFANFYQLAKKDCIEISSLMVHKILAGKCKAVLEVARTSRAQSIIDGQRNIWIIKPGHSSQGRGIEIRIRLDDIVAREFRKNIVIQKYIEKPLLIYDTKFDIRQWFVVTSWNPLTIWMSHPSYLRFCSQLFSMDLFHESIHLCNNAVQSKYSNGRRSCHLPEENMWTSEEFVAFLAEKGLADYWESKIYPGMKHAIIEIMMASKSRMVGCVSARNQAFELFGADFLLSQDFNPWLIEINASPALGPTTSVTARMVPQLLKDILNLTIGHEHLQNKVKATVGTLVCIYSEEEEQLQKRRNAAERSRKNDKEDQEGVIHYIDRFMSVPSCMNNECRVDLVKAWITKASNKLRKASGRKRTRLAAASRGCSAKTTAPRYEGRKLRPADLHLDPPGISCLSEDLDTAPTANAKVRHILSKVPVCLDERVLFKYKCNHCL